MSEASSHSLQTEGNGGQLSARTLFRLGVTCLKEGKFEEAEHFLKRTTEIDPEFADAWCNRGIAFASRGQPTMAEKVFRQAVDLCPDRPDFLRNLGNSLIASAKYEEAAECFKQSLKLDPTSIAALLSMAKLLASLGKSREAMNCLRRILTLQPQHKEALDLSPRVQDIPDSSSLPAPNGSVDQQELRKVLDRGLASGKAKQFDVAQAEFNLATRMNPWSAEAFAYLGSLQIELKEDDKAIESFHSALANCAGEATLYLNLGGLYQRQGMMETAINCFRAAILCSPEYEKAYLNLGRIFARQRRFGEAIEHVTKAIQLVPTSYEALYQLGVIQYLLDDTESAINCLRHAMQFNQNDPNGYAILAQSLVNRGDLEDGAKAAESALHIQPAHEGALSTLIHQLQHMCNWDRLDTLAQRAISVTSDDSKFAEADYLSEPFSPFTFVALPTATTPEQQLNCAIRHVALRQSSLKQLEIVTKHRSNRKVITIGYLSADFREHPVANLIVGLFEAHDRNRFQVFGYSYGADDGSGIRHRIKMGFDRFVEFNNASDLEAARRIAADEVDILIDLTGHTRGWRIDILAHRPAPVIVHYLGYPGTTGAPFIDYLLADEFVVPPDQSSYYSEKLVYMPGSFLVNDCQHRLGPNHLTRADCNLPLDAFVFCCFNGGYKITPLVFDIWMKLLDSIPSAVLWLKDNNRFANSNLQREAERRGIQSDRLIFAPRCDTLQEHIARYRLADLFLDTFPYNAHTTASDSLLAGCPVLTYAGNAFSARVAGSLLQAVGLPELVTTTWEEYQSIALDLARNPLRFAELRARLNVNRATSSLFKMDVFARNIEEAYIKMWAIHTAGESPRSFRV